MRVLAILAAFAAVLMVSAAADTAEARRGGGGGGHGGGHSGGHSSGRAHFSSHSAPRFHAAPRHHFVQAGPRHVYRNSVYTARRHVVVSDRCSWLRHRALATGSRVWWQRYYACRSGMYY